MLDGSQDTQIVTFSELLELPIIILPANDPVLKKLIDLFWQAEKVIIDLEQVIKQTDNRNVEFNDFITLLFENIGCDVILIKDIDQLINIGRWREIVIEDLWDISKKHSGTILIGTVPRNDEEDLVH